MNNEEFDREVERIEEEFQLGLMMAAVVFLGLILLILGCSGLN